MSENYKLTLVAYPKGQKNWVVQILLDSMWVLVEDQLFFAKRDARAYAKKLMKDMV